MADNGLSLKQRNPLGVDIQINLVNARDLQIASKGKKTKHVYSVDIISLKNKSKKTLYIAWNWLVLSLICVAVMLLLLNFLPPYFGANKNMYLVIIFCSGVLGAFVCFILFLKQSRRTQVFFSRNANVPIIILSVDTPNKKTFSSFIHSLEQHIKKTQEKMNLSEEKQLVGEMKMLRRLSNEKVISKKSYNLAKDKLFHGFDSHFVKK